MQKTIKKLKQKNSKLDDVVIGQNVDEIHQVTSSNLFDSLDNDGDGFIIKNDVINALEDRGILLSDPRIQELEMKIRLYKDTEKIDRNGFHDLIFQNITLVEKALKGDLVIPDFLSFKKEIVKIFEDVRPIMDGAVADYIPQLARVNPENYAISICTIDGQQLHLGNHDVPYCVQSTCKPINYCIALEDFGEGHVHNHIGREPSGRSFNELTLNNRNLPHNPMINAGAIMSCSLIQPELNVSDRFDYVLSVWEKMLGNRRPGFNNAVYLSEKQTADRNFALGYFMRENNAFPEGTDLHEILEFYFQCCSIEVTCGSHAKVAGTLANAGICPTTRERVLSPTTTKNCLSLMYSCGMYDFSGEFAFSVGLPAKSGVSGSLVIVVPGVCGICIWSPNLDRYGNSVRGVEACNRLVKRFNFHNYDNLIKNNEKLDPRLQKNEDKLDGIMVANFAASQGDLNEIKGLKAKGVDLNDSDYDLRTPIHLAAAEGHRNIIEYFILNGMELAPKDRWGLTPIEDAKNHGKDDIVSLLEKAIAKKGGN